MTITATYEQFFSARFRRHLVNTGAQDGLKYWEELAFVKFYRQGIIQYV